MQLTKFMRQMGRNDVKLVSRDQFVIGLAMYPIMILLALRFGVPPLTDWLQASYDFDLSPYYIMMVGYGLLIMTPMFMGLVFGMLLVEEQDDRTLTAMMVTPVSLDSYVQYRAIAAAVLAFAILLIAMPAVGIVSVPYWNVAIVSLFAVLNAPMTALFFFSLAHNKVQAFGVLKIVSSLNVVPLLAWFVSEPWQFLFGLYPPYWAVKAYWAAAAGEPFLIYFVPAVVLYAGVMAFLIRRFRIKAYGSID